MNVSMKKGLLGLFATVTLMGAGMAQADDPEWALYNGIPLDYIFVEGGHPRQLWFCKVSNFLKISMIESIPPRR